jgi:hypothetical protein
LIQQIQFGPHRRMGLLDLVAELSALDIQD